MSHLPTQDDIEHTNLSGIQEFAFDVRGAEQGVHNGGVAIEMTFGNVDGSSPHTAATIVLEYCGPPEHPGDPEGFREVARYFNKSFVYLQAPTRFHASFSPTEAYPLTQQPYDVSRMDLLTDLDRYVPDGSDLVPVSAATVVKKPRVLATRSSRTWWTRRTRKVARRRPDPLW